jgi:hypothetical protein
MATTRAGGVASETTYSRKQQSKKPLREQAERTTQNAYYGTAYSGRSCYSLAHGAGITYKLLLIQHLGEPTSPCPQLIWGVQKSRVSRLATSDQATWLPDTRGCSTHRPKSVHQQGSRIAGCCHTRAPIMDEFVPAGGKGHVPRR